MVLVCFSSVNSVASVAQCVVGVYMPKFDNVSVTKKANVYFDGKCVSHTVHFADGKRKSVGVIFPAKLTFKTGEPELMEIIGGKCRDGREG